MLLTWQSSTDSPLEILSSNPSLISSWYGSVLTYYCHPILTALMQQTSSVEQRTHAHSYHCDSFHGI